MNIDMDAFIEVDKINIYEFSEKINNLTKEQNKQEFLKNYNDYKTMIENIDDFICLQNNEKIDLKNMQITELINLLNTLAPENTNLKNKNLSELIHINNIISTIESKIDENSDFSIQKIN